MWKDDSIAADILLAAQDIQKFTAGLTRDEFAHSGAIQSAVIFKIIVSGEAAKRSSDEFRRQHPQINWKQIAGMRDQCVHGYSEIDVDKVWEVVTEERQSSKRILRVFFLNRPTDKMSMA